MRWLALGIAGVLVLAVIWALFVPVADWLAHHDVGSATGSLYETAVDNARGRLLALGAGLFAAGALVFAALGFNLLRRNSEQAGQWQRRSHELTEQGQVTDRYTKAVEQLASDKLDVRIGGIYALERIARDSATDHPTVMEVLAAFIRDHSHEPWPLPEHGTDPVSPQTTRPDVQAAVTVIGRRAAKRDIRAVDLSGANLRGANLRGANLSGADLYGADLRDANLIDSHLDGADLNGGHLDGAYLTHANLARAYLGGANLAKAYLNGADLRGADLDSANLSGADLSEAHIDAGYTAFAADLTGAIWPVDTPVPPGWKPDTGSGRLKRADPSPEQAEA